MNAICSARVNSSVRRLLEMGSDMKLFIAAVIICISSTLSGAGSLPQRVEVSGFVVAKHKLMGTSISKENLQTEMVIFRLEKHEKLAWESLYIIVYYQRRLDEPALPAEFFKFGKQWCLILTRVPNCDRTVKKIVSNFSLKFLRTNNLY